MAESSYTIIVNAPAIADGELADIVTRAADGIACSIDDNVSTWDVDVIEGTYANPLSGDNIHGLGRNEPGDEADRVNPRWNSDVVQFARLLAEIIATHSEIDYAALSESMGLELARIDDMFERAQRVWEQAKERV